MPYLKRSDKEFWSKELDALCTLLTETKHHSHISGGDVNYLLTKILLSTRPGRYEEYNTLIGALECCKFELYRRAISVYEDQKIQENGDVYDC